jgi:hypothetical protein
MMRFIQRYGYGYYNRRARAARTFPVRYRVAPRTLPGFPAMLYIRIRQSVAAGWHMRTLGRSIRVYRGGVMAHWVYRRRMDEC